MGLWALIFSLYDKYFPKFKWDYICRVPGSWWAHNTLSFFSFHQAYFLSKDRILVNYKDTYLGTRFKTDCYYLINSLVIPTNLNPSISLWNPARGPLEDGIGNWEDWKLANGHKLQSLLQSKHNGTTCHFGGDLKSTWFGVNLMD